MLVILVNNQESRIRLESELSTSKKATRKLVDFYDYFNDNYVAASKADVASSSAAIEDGSRRKERDKLHQRCHEKTGVNAQLKTLCEDIRDGR